MQLPRATTTPGQGKGEGREAHRSPDAERVWERGLLDKAGMRDAATMVGLEEKGGESLCSLPSLPSV